MTSSAGRRALLISPSFFGYEAEIAREITSQGYDVRYLDERPSNSAWARAVVRRWPGLMRRRVATRFAHQRDALSGERFDLIVVVKAEVVPRWFLESLRRDNPEARMVFYAYDSFAGSPNCLEVVDVFDVRFSFDPIDVASRPDFEYLPLFYVPDFTPAPAEAGRDFVCSFVGTLHSDRYELVKKVVLSQTPSFAFLYVQARWYFLLTKYVTRENRKVRWGDVAFETMDRGSVAATFRSSRAVLDIPRDGQAGLTMRTFEVLASGAALITTNRSILDEPFYDATRVLLLSADDVASGVDPISERIAALPENTGVPAGFESYSLSHWVARITGERDALCG